MADTEKRITAKMVLDDTGFNASLQGVNQQLRLSQSELKNASAGIQAFGKDSERLASVQKTLAQQVELQSKKVDIYKQSIDKTNQTMQNNIRIRDELKPKLSEATASLDKITSASSKELQAYMKNREELKKLDDQYKKAVKTYGENSDAAQKLKSRITELESAQQKIVQTSGKEVAEYEKAQKSVDSLTKRYNDKEKAIESNAKTINSYTTNMNKAEAQLSKFQGELNKTNSELAKSNNSWLNASKSLEAGSKSFKSVGEGASKAGDTLLKMSVPLVGIGVAAAKVGMDFDSQMSRVKAISGATGEEFEKLRNQAVQLGADTAFNAQEAAQGMENLASAGFNTNEIMSAMPGMLDLAASSGEDLANSADIAASTLRGFGIEAGQAGHVADVLAKNAAATNAAVADTGEAMKYAATPAHALGISLEETTAAIGIMANAGIKGSQAGTTLRGALKGLTSPGKEAAALMEQIGFKAFDTQGKMLPLNQVIANLQKTTKGMTDQQKQSTIATIFGQEAMSGMLSLVQAGPQQLSDLTQSLKNSDGAAKDMAETMQDNAKSSIEQMMGSLETAGIKLEQNFAPTIKAVADTIGNLADKFGQLSPGTQKVIVGFAGLTLAAGGTLKVVGGAANGISGILGLLGKLSGGIGAATVAAGAAETATVGVSAATASAGTAVVGATAASGGLAAGLGTLAIAAAPWLLAGAGVVAAGIGIHHVLTQQAVPAVDLFADKTSTTAKVIKDQYGNAITTVETNTIKLSESTKKAVGSYIQLDDGVKKALTNLYVNSTTITNQTVTTMVGKYQEMGNKIKAGMDKHYQDEYTSLQAFFNKSSALSTSEEQKALQSLQTNNNNKKASVDNYSKQIQAILQKASSQHRSLTQQEQQQINSIQSKMRDNAVHILSDNEVQAKVIMERIKDYGSRITAEQASEVIKNANKQRDGAIKSANDQYSKTIAAIIKARDESHSITADQANKLIADAKKQRDGTVNHAQDMRDKVVSKVTNMNSETSKNVDTTTGNILTKWEKVKKFWDNLNFPAKVMKVTQVIASVMKPVKDASDTANAVKGVYDIMHNNAKGTDYYEGGLTTMHEKGYEVYNLPRGSRIYNHEASEDLVRKTAESVATKVAGSVLNGFTGNSQVQTIIVPINLDGEQIAKVTASYDDKIQGRNIQLAGRNMRI